MSEQGQPWQPTIVSIQSQVVFGCAGNNAAVPLLQKLGATVYAVPTVLLSNTPHYPSIGGIDIAPDTVEQLLTRLLERVPAKNLTAILTGYIRDAATATVVASFIDRVRNDNPGIIVLVDPVMGDTDLGLFIPEEAAHCVMDKLVTRADITTPNLFEARLIVGKPDVGAEDLQSVLLNSGAGISVMTGLGLEQAASEVQTLAFERGQCFRASSPRLDIRPTGTGDLLAAAFLFHWLDRRDVTFALRESVANVFSLLQQAVDGKLQELEPARLKLQSSSMTQ
ncbi:MAG: pyridoxal kinase [Granulosicoccus sp.]|nr:pyridoxal kinase [Granulosicoccus sp.]